MTLQRWLLAGITIAAGAAVATGLYGARGAEADRRAEAEMATTAQAFIATLDSAGRAKAVRSFDDADRLSWHFVPRDRTGLPLREMRLGQRAAALALLQAATSTQGFQKATGVMRLEGILGELEGRPDRRDPQNYHFWIFGAPVAGQPWGWRFEGHHISLNFTSAGGVSVATPSFIGANPAQVRAGPYAGWRLLANEEDAARTLVRSLDAAQRARAIIAATAPSDIITGNARSVVLELVDGLPASAMNAAQRDLLRHLLAEYLDNMDPAIAGPRYARIEETGFERLHFAWAGTVEPGGPHYYRIHGPTLLIEYDNTQNDANHIHSVWRDLENDFGEDLLRLHYERAGPEHGHDQGSEPYRH